MKTSTFLTALRAAIDLPLVFRADGDVISPGYHLTEVKRVAYETMDCGAQLHRWAESQFELWVPPLADITSGRRPMAAGKFLRIVERVEAELPLTAEATARIHASFAGQPAALYEVDRVETRDGQLWIELVADRTRCKAAERRLAAATGACCGTAESESETPATQTACGCAVQRGAAAATCCA